MEIAKPCRGHMTGNVLTMAAGTEPRLTRRGATCLQEVSSLAWASSVNATATAWIRSRCRFKAASTWSQATRT